MTDPRLKTQSWQRIVKYWRALRAQPCARCMGAHGPIDYDSPRFVLDEHGRKHENVWALDVGHVLGRDLDHRDTWSVDDTQPEHALCNRQAGSRYRHAKHGQARALPVTSRDW
jgi:hypothetical protein